VTVQRNREFATFRRGELRDDALADFRNWLRSATDEATGELFDEETIAAATAQGGRYWNESDSLDLVLQARQAAALWLANQGAVEKSGTGYLRGHHAPLWRVTPLPAVGGSGRVVARAAAGTIYIGSTTLGDSAAHVATDPAGLRYQVLTTEVVPSNGATTLTLVGLDDGPQTNLAPGASLAWSSPPSQSEPTCEASEQFRGGRLAETDAELRDRIRDIIRHRPGAGNLAHVRAWARESSVAIEDAFVYACGMGPGSTVVAITQRRSGAVGPLARVPTAAVLSSAVSYLVSPGSRVVPGHWHVVIVPAVSEPSDASVRLALPRASDHGWLDRRPWPEHNSYPASATALTTNGFDMRSDTPPPLGSGSSPGLMRWNRDTSNFEALAVQSVFSLGGDEYRVVLEGSAVPEVGDYISPMTSIHELISSAAERYYDGLGPSEVIAPDTTPFDHRAARFVEPSEKFPYRAGSGLALRIADSLDIVSSDTDLASMAPKSPPIPVSPMDGPRFLTLGNLGVYPLD
jgi:uncharacterized phage protein gp47/JayE